MDTANANVFRDVADATRAALADTRREHAQRIARAAQRQPATETPAEPRGLADALANGQTTLPTIPVRLDDIDGTARFHGELLPLAVGKVAAVRHDGQFYVDTGGIVGSGSSPTRRIFQRVAPAVLVSATLI